LRKLVGEGAYEYQYLMRGETTQANQQPVYFVVQFIDLQEKKGCIILL
jgi:hypothetical protein